MKTLVIEPLPERGLRVAIAQDDAWLVDVSVDHAEDVVAVLAHNEKKLAHADRIMIRARIGSFSASRTAIVLGNTLSATMGIPVVVVETSLVTPEDVTHAARKPIRHFDYSAAPNITIKKP